MGKLTFRRFLEQRRHDNNVIGDVAADALSDVYFECFTGQLTPERLREHIEAEHDSSYFAGQAVYDALDAAEEAWLEARGDEPVSIPRVIISRALRKARAEYVRVSEEQGTDPGPENECWAEFERLASYAS